MLLSQLGQQNWLMASLLYGSGLRLKECLRLRVKDIDFDYKQIVVLSTRAANRRVTLVPYKKLSKFETQAPLLNCGAMGGLKEKTGETRN
jgi:integrase